MTESPMSTLQRELATGATVILDGATGTEIERRGAAMHHAAWCAMATLSHPEILREVHVDYIRAGARIITTNTFSSNRNMLEPAGLGDRFEEMNRRAVAIALEARDAAGVDGVVVAGSMSHQVPIMAQSDVRHRRAVPAAGVARQNFRDMAAVLADSGVDFLLMEMMSDPDLMVPAVEAARDTGLPVWVGFSVRRGVKGDTHAFSRPDVSVQQMVESLSLEGIGAAGIMHSAAELTLPAVDVLRECFVGPLMAYPDSGYFRMPNWQFENIMPPEQFVTSCREWRTAGVQILGGCCGLGVEHIGALREL